MRVVARDGVVVEPFVAPHVAHLPLVLYHWRAVPGSTALSGEAKMYSFDAGIRAVSEALARRGVPAEAKCGRRGSLDMNAGLMADLGNDPELSKTTLGVA